MCIAFHRFAFAGVMISALKLYIAVPDVLVVGIRCNINGRSPDLAKVQKILTWLACVSVSKIRGFLGMCGMVRMFIKGFAETVKPLTDLTKKHLEFVWDERAVRAMSELKEKV